MSMGRERERGRDKRRVFVMLCCDLPASDAKNDATATPVEGSKLDGGGIQMVGNTGNPNAVNEDPGKGDGIPEIADQDHGEWLVVTRKKRPPPKNQQSTRDIGKPSVAGTGKNSHGPTNKSINVGPVEEVGPNVKSHAFKMDSGKRRRHDKSTPTHVLLKNVGKEVYINPMQTGTPNLSTGALLAPQGVFFSVPGFRKEDPVYHPPPEPPFDSVKHSSPVLQVASSQTEGSIEIVPDSQVSQSHDLVSPHNVMLMHE
ncbi:hypothetical protein RIF29_25046 [Crotalaria pallida]|uniref:Uncharacterized protein n=1 Tax=Crotalaria pallida TaxID=3830 RepID=A0AAN9EKV0_CROPI